MPAVTVTDHNSTPHREVTVDVVTERWKDGRRNVRRADNRRLLGWITRTSDERRFEVRVAPGAFRGDGPDDTGNILDDVPAYLTHEWQPFQCHAVSEASQMGDVVDDLVLHLARQHAPAVGYGRHPGVDRWEDRRRQH